jgi:predicted RNA-binding Zn ribbon-like protein
MPTAAAPSERTWMLSDEPLPVRLMSTVWADADGLHDDLRTTADLDQWLQAVGLHQAGPGATDGELAKARALRDAVRRLAAYVTRDGRPAAASALTDVGAALDRVNAAAAELPPPGLVLSGGRLERGAQGSPSPVTAGLAQVAKQAVQLLGGEDAARLRACYAPGCVLYFVKTHPRREWCSVACGNRVRAARHYHKVREHNGGA